MSERIFLTYSNATAVPYEGSILGHHVVLNYIDANGEHHTLQGVPQNRFEHNLGKLGAFLQEEVLSDGTRNTDSPFGRLKAVEGVGDKGDISTTQLHTPIAEGGDLSAQWALMRDFGDEVNFDRLRVSPVLAKQQFICWWCITTRAALWRGEPVSGTI